MNEYMIRIKHGRISSMVPGLLFGHHTFQESGRLASDVSGRPGRIHSIFRTSLNLQFGERLVHVGTEAYGLCCFGMTVDDAAVQMILKTCQVGNRVVLKKDGLYVYSVGQVVVLEISGFVQVDLRIPKVTELEWVDKSLLYQELAFRAAALDLGLERDEAFEAYSQILAGIWDMAEGADETAEVNINKTEALSDAVRFFLGRGKGLTPAGDDILIGYGAVLQAFGQGEPLVRLLEELPSKTTDVSQAYLSAMMEGYANESFCDIILQIFCEEVLKLRELLCRMEKIGNTSGRDTIYGMYLGLRKMKEAYIV